MKNKARLDHPRLLVRVGDDAPGDYHDYRHCDDYAVIVGKMRRRHKHVCAIFQPCCAILLPVDTQVLFFLHLAVKIYL